MNTWGYDIQDRTVSNFSRDGKGVDIEYESDTQVNITDAYGKEREYFLETTMSGRKRVSSIINGPGGAEAFPWSASNAVSWIYDSNMLPTEVESAGGTVNQYFNYDNRGNPGTVKLAFGAPEERTIHYSYHPDMNAPLARKEPSVLGGGDKETIWDYDNDYDLVPNENPTSLVSRIIEKGFTRNAAGNVVAYEYITIFTYNSEGQVLTIDGPLPGNGDMITFTYDLATGDLLSITRPIIGSTTFSGYDQAGQVGLVTDVNGQSKSFMYDARGRVILITNNADGSSSSVAYNTSGLPGSRMDEDGIESSFEYDPVYGRLFKRFDHEGNYIQYGYDAQGNVIEKGYYDPSDVRTNRKRSLYQDPAHDMPGLLFKEINGDDTFTQYGYDLEGNVASVTDPKGYTTYYEYDPLNRLKTVTQSVTVVTTYTYDGHGNLASVTDAESHTTTYQYDDMGRLITTTSQDTGTVTYVYDEAVNPVNKKDAKDITVNYLYDTLNRLTNVNFPDSAQDIAYTYDSGTNSMGRRTGMVDESGSMTFGYDARGRLTGKTSIVNGITYDISRSYTPGSRVSSVTYPSGRTVDYHRTSCACSVDSITTTYNSDTKTLMENMSYRPFGGANGMDTGAGGTVGSQFDDSGRMIVSNPGAEHERTYEYDNNGNLTSISAPSTPWYNRTYTYDSLNRLTHAEGTYGVIGYTYDDVGNRLTKTKGSVTDTYAYIPGTNVLDTVTNGETTVYTHDANGNITAIGNKILTYNQNNRLIMVEEGGNTLGEYTYNGLGQRIIKEAGGVTTVFHYDFDGNIIGKSDLSGSFSKEYLYRGSSRLALIDVSIGEMYYFGNDRLGTPQVLTDSTNTVVWEGYYKPFGEAEVNPNSSVVNNFRFSGQYFDSETGLHYNYHRYYDPKTGRYLKADPIGIKGGTNPYLYTGNNPINKTDPMGLSDCSKCDDCPCGSWSGTGHTYGGFFAIGGWFTTHIAMNCNCSDASIKLIFTNFQLGVGMGGSWEITRYHVWGACNKEDVKRSNHLTAGGSGGHLGVGGSSFASGGIDKGSFAYGIGGGLGWHASWWSDTRHYR
ncbi:RHS repeat-associated core domain-containing protein [Thermodesulfobacteriota bacterium]